MRNRILSITRNTIPYVKEVMPLAKSVTGCILMQQLDYWFERFPNGFYKFQDAAPGNAHYRPGESWSEELGFSLAEFRTAFDKIGVRYVSKTEYVAAAADPFQGKFYCCYTDRRAGMTFYFRNHELVDKSLDDLIRSQPSATDVQPGLAENRPVPMPKPANLGQKSIKFTVAQEHSLPVKVDSAFTGNRDSLFPVDTHSQPLVDADTQSTVDAESLPPQLTNVEQEEMEFLNAGITETTVSKTTEPQQPASASSAKLASSNPDEKRCGGDDDFENLVFPPNLASAERDGLIAALRKCEASVHQDLLDEIAGVQAGKGFRMGMVPFAHALVRAVDEGRFVLTAGVVVRKGRENRRTNGVQIASTEAALTAQVRPLTQLSDAELSKFPPNMRKRMEEARAKQLCDHAG
ncbi:hypothetical protein BUMB_03036 [Candidatus Paraburkholderia calva]|nr:hypothetical protein BUMB_03036 [Candidatus Paraburkholderia calva]